MFVIGSAVVLHEVGDIFDKVILLLEMDLVDLALGNSSELVLKTLCQAVRVCRLINCVSFKLVISVRLSL